MEERIIVLLRHGIAEDPTPAKKDEDRSLTAQGHARMKRIAKGLADLLPKAEAIYSSPLLRAVQTSLWVSKGYKSRVNVTTTDTLAPGATAKDLLAYLAKSKARRIICVGHEPNLTEALRAFIRAEACPFELKKGGCYGVRIGTDGRATLEWVLTPRILRKLG